MECALEVGAVLDTLTPAAWVVDLLERLERHSLINLHIICTDEQLDDGKAPANSHSSLVETITAPRRSTPLGRAAQWVLNQRTDRPQFPNLPWATSTLNACHQVGKANGSTAPALPHCAVILNLTSAGMQRPIANNENTPVWCAHPETIKARVKEALLLQAPLIWIFLWAETASNTRAQVLACHALPRQTYSLSDLQRAAFSCLPALIESRLNWMANGVDVAATEQHRHSATDAQIRAERKAAYEHALAISSTHYTVESRSDLSLFTSVCSLLFHQSIARVRGRLFRDQWQLAISGYEDDKPRNIEKLHTTPVTAYTSLKVPDNTLWADPHLYEHDDKRYVFFEEMKINADYAHLSVATLDESNQLNDVRTVLDEGHHLSYPFIFGHEGEHYMIPETTSKCAVSLYHATAFPDKWEWMTDLISDVKLADTTLHYDNGTWWMFTNSMSHSCVDERDELNIYHAQSLSGPWLAHPLNPVITGVDTARMAGPLINDGGQLYRVSQYGAHRYGYGINVHRIEQLDHTGYRETATGRILPDESGPWLGCHSVSQLRGVTVLDRLKRVRR